MYQKKISELLTCAEKLKHSSYEQLCDRIVQAVCRCLTNGNKLLFIGNGGSAAEAQHMAAEYCATLSSKNFRNGYKALALTTDSSFLTAWSNDFGFEDVFARQIEVIGGKGDILFAYSTSGNSENIIRGAEMAKRGGLEVVAFTGIGEGKLDKFANYLFKSPSTDTARIQEMHTFFGHTICSMVETDLGDISY